MQLFRSVNLQKVGQFIVSETLLRELGQVSEEEKEQKQRKLGSL